MNTVSIFSIVTLVMALSACTATTDAPTTALLIERGMTSQQVMQIISQPTYGKERTFKGRGTAIQFCEGFGLGAGQYSEPVQYVIVWLVDDRVDGLTQYRNQAANMFASCSLGFREIDWGQAPADVRIKLDID